MAKQSGAKKVVPALIGLILAIGAAAVVQHLRVGSDPDDVSLGATTLGRALSEDQTAAWAATTLANLPVISRADLAEAKNHPYDRAAFPHWEEATVGGWGAQYTGCTARQATMIRDGQGVVVEPEDCWVAKGAWTDPYTGDVSTQYGAVSVDHVVPLAAAWKAGAWQWSEAQRTKFANDPDELAAVGYDVNQDKGAKGPDEWLPDNPDAWCAYAVRWIAVKDEYALPLLNEDERTALERALDTCAADGA
ncbi:MAG: HNH endonuclease family protein [Bifidobacteriaceae bacterium]|nr:HNH endonuclease family protein [Bifidobacteriaceae bacterium]